MTRGRRVNAVYGGGPTVEEGMLEDHLNGENYDEQLVEEIDKETWTPKQEIVAKWRHLTDVIDANNSYVVVPDAEAKDGIRLTVMWVMAVRDSVLKARLCARDFASDKRDDLFAPGATSLTNRVIDLKAVKNGLGTYTVDVTAAYNTLEEPELVYVRPPQEWLDERAKQGLDTRVRWNILWLLPGRRVAAKIWVEHLGQIHKEMGFVQNQAVGQFYHHANKKVTCEIHMDDIHGCGPTENIEEVLSDMRSNLKLKKAMVHEPNTYYQHLKRYRHVVSDGWLIRANPSHVQVVAKRLGLETAKFAVVPLSEALRPSAEDSEEPLYDEWKSEYRSLVMTLLYASLDTAEVQFALRTVTTDMQEPSMKSSDILKKVTKYLKGVLEEGVWFPVVGKPDVLKVSTDSDWAGDRRTRKSTTCIVVQCGNCTLYTASVGQSIHSQSSGEAEFYAAVSGMQAGLGLQYLMATIGMPTTIELQLDSSAAQGVLWRSCVGKIRHLEVKTRWVQRLVSDGKVTVKAVPGAQNVADIGTRILTHDRIEDLKNNIGIKNLLELVPKQFTSQAAAIQTPFGKKVAAMIAFLGPQAAATSGTVCRRDLEHFAQAKEDIWPSIVQVILACLAVGFGMGLAVGCYFGRQTEKATTASKMSQAQTTYTRKATQPRFRPLADTAHGGVRGPMEVTE